MVKNGFESADITQIDFLIFSSRNFFVINSDQLRLFDKNYRRIRLRVTGSRAKVKHKIWNRIREVGVANMSA